MLAYRHLFHAGNFSDVFKHALLTRLFIALARKDRPYFYLDTHAGIGRYDLTHPWASKNAEYLGGIARLWARNDAPATLMPYLEAVRALNPDGSLRFYPGSPLLATRFLRAGDRMVLCELSREDCATLQALLARDARATVQNTDGYAAVKAYLPPKERRGLVLIDSSFDRAHEFKRLTEALNVAHGRFANGVQALWYPLMEAAAMRAFERDVVRTGIRKILRLELALRGRAGAGLRGCGLLVVNPPFGFEAEARALLGWLAPVLAADDGATRHVDWLSPELAPLGDRQG